jgi:hypothetical protein
MKISHFQEKDLIVLYRISINFGKHLKTIWTPKIFSKEVRILSSSPKVAQISLQIVLSCLSKITSRKSFWTQKYLLKSKMRRKSLRSFSRFGQIWNISKITSQREILNLNRTIVLKMIVWMKEKMKWNFSTIYSMK